MATEQEKKSWEQMSNAEKKESFDKYMKYKLFEAHTNRRNFKNQKRPTSESGRR